MKIVARVINLSAGAPHVAVCMDSGWSFRHDVDPQYKANRPEREAALHHQIDLAVEQLTADGFPIWKVRGFEADDIIATAACKAMELPGDVPVQIVTGDKDLLQLVCEQVTAKSTRDGTLLDSAGVVAKFGVRPDQMRDYLTLVGDSSDNVKGVKGIGPKRAVELLTTYQTIDEMYRLMDAGTVPGLTLGIRTALADFRSQLPLTRQLITLRTDVEIPFNEIAAERQPREVARCDFDEDAMTTDTNQDTQPEPLATEATGGTAQAIAIREPDVLAPAPVEWERQLEPRSMREVKVIATDIHNSRLFMGAFGNPQAVMTTLLAGRELGLQTMASLRGIHIVEGRPTLSAQLMVALIMKSGQAVYFRPVSISATEATFETLRVGEEKPFSLTHTIEMATRAGLVKPKSNWEKTPEDMLVARCTSRLARLKYADILFGLYTPEEMRESHDTAVA